MTESKPHVARSTGNNEWVTPEPIVNAARYTMRAIDLDPASSSSANMLVRATRFFDLDNDGLSQEWSGRVWLNPPYGRGLITPFVDKLLSSTSVTEAVVLTNNGTETEWGQRLLAAANWVCFPNKRIKFLMFDGAEFVVHGAPLQGQMVCGIRVDGYRFERAFGVHGATMLNSWTWPQTSQRSVTTNGP